MSQKLQSAIQNLRAEIAETPMTEIQRGRLTNHHKEVVLGVTELLGSFKKTQDDLAIAKSELAKEKSKNIAEEEITAE